MELKECMEEYIFMMFPDLNPKSKSAEDVSKQELEGIELPWTGVLPDLESLLSEYKEIRKEYMLHS